MDRVMECPCCGNDCVTLDADGRVSDGQLIECGCDGWVSCDTESEPYIQVPDEPCRCGR
jgi:hypothetical protein